MPPPKRFSDEELRLRRNARARTPAARAKKRSYERQPERVSVKKTYYERRKDERYWLSYVYPGFTKSRWERMFETQGRCCSACGSPDPGHKNGYWATDHCHILKKVRGILCQPCNRTLGHSKEDPRRLRCLADYAERHNGPARTTNSS